MNKAELEKVLKSHAAWRRGEECEEGERANLYGANLSRADFREANLSEANLHGAKNILRLPVGDPRGYDCVAVRHSDGWRILAGCRWFTVEEAHAHWGDADYGGDSEIAARYLYALEWLAKQNA